MINYQIILTEAEIRALAENELNNNSLYISSDTQKLFTFIEGELVTLSLNMSEMQGTIKLKGIVETVDNLPATTTFVGGELYLVGTEAPYLEYVYSATAGEYIKFGEVVDVPSTYVDSVDILESEILVLSHSTDKCDDVSIDITEPKATFDIPGTVTLGEGLVVETVDDVENVLVARASDVVEFFTNDASPQSGCNYYPKNYSDSHIYQSVQGDYSLNCYSTSYTTRSFYYYYYIKPIKILDKYYITLPEELELEYEVSYLNFNHSNCYAKHQVQISLGGKWHYYTRGYETNVDNKLVYPLTTPFERHTKKFTYQEGYSTNTGRIVEIPTNHIDSNGFAAAAIYCYTSHTYNVSSSSYRYDIRNYMIRPIGYFWEVMRYKQGSYDSATNLPTIDGIEFNGDITDAITKLKYDDTQTIKQYLDTLNSVTFDRNVLYTTSTTTPVTKYNSYKFRLDGRTGASSYSSSAYGIPASWRNKNYFPNMDLTFELGDEGQTTTLYAWYIVKY